MGTKQKPCKSCGNMLDSSAKVCPQCGKKQNRIPKWIFIVLGVIGLIWAISDGIGGWNSAGYSQEVNMVRGGYLQACPNKTIGQMVDGYFGNPKWSSGKSQGNEGIEDGQILVNLKGKVSYMDKPVDAVMQFVFSKDGKNFEIQALEVNGIPQNILMIAGLLESMCEGE